VFALVRWNSLEFQAGCYGGGGADVGGGGGGSSNPPADVVGLDSSATLRVTITYARPYVLQVSPSTGPHAGGTPITITGAGFGPGAIVKLGQGHGAGRGSLTATMVTVVTSGEISAVTPKAKAGTWNVFVVNPGSLQSPPHPADRFTYT
jgi:hypothetical protein